MTCFPFPPFVAVAIGMELQQLQILMRLVEPGRWTVGTVMLSSPSLLTDPLFVCLHWQHEQYSHSSRTSVGGESSREKREQSLPGRTHLFIRHPVLNLSRFPSLSLALQPWSCRVLLLWESSNSKNRFSREVATATCQVDCCERTTKLQSKD